MSSPVQVKHDYYAKPKYGTPERFLSYQKQMTAIRDSGAQSVLLIGVGDGLVPYYLREVLGLAVTTLDIDPELQPDVVGDVKSMPLDDASFDVVAAFEVLEHLPFEDFSTCLREMARVSRRDAFVSIPFRSTSFDLVCKFPGIRTLLKRDHLRLRLSVPVKFPGFAASTQHYWEISRGFPKRKVHQVVREHFDLVRSEHVLFHAYGYFMTLRKKTG